MVLQKLSVTGQAMYVEPNMKARSCNYCPVEKQLVLNFLRVCL